MGRASDITFARLAVRFAAPQKGFIRLWEVLAVIQVKKARWWEGVKSGRFPKPVTLSTGCTVWRAEDIRALIKQLAEIMLIDRPNGDVSGHSKPASKGRMKTSHSEGSIAYWAAKAAHGRNERTHSEYSAFDINFGGQWLVQPADCA